MRDHSICISVLYTGDIDDAVPFYERLFGWRAVHAAYGDGRHRLFQWQGQTVAAVQQSDALSEWVPHVRVADVEAATAAAVALGAARIDAITAPGVARLAVLRDREARFGLWQPAPVEGATLTDGIGSLWWAEVLSDDPPVARQFYSSLFGWSARETAFEPFDAYTVFEREGVQEGGVLAIGRDWGVTPHWNSIFAVDDCDATMRHACEMGGSAGFVHTVPKYGRLGSAIDPRGAWIWLKGTLPA